MKMNSHCRAFLFINICLSVFQKAGSDSNNSALFMAMEVSKPYWGIKVEQMRDGMPTGMQEMTCAAMCNNARNCKGFKVKSVTSKCELHSVVHPPGEGRKTVNVFVKEKQCPVEYVSLILSCYKFVTEPATDATKAYKKCKDNEGILAEPKNHVEMSAVLKYVAQNLHEGDYYIGGYKRYRASWEWYSDQSPMPSTSWLENYPSQNKSDISVAVRKTPSCVVGLVNTNSRKKVNGYICQEETSL